MKKLVFVLLAVLTLAACEKNDDNLELANEGISEVEMNLNAFRAGDVDMVDRVTVQYAPITSTFQKELYRNKKGPLVGMISWYTCPNTPHAEVWVLNPGTEAEILNRTIPIHNDAPPKEEDLPNIRLNIMQIGDTCNSVFSPN